MSCSNDITGGATPASFEPTIDYVVTKIPRFTFEKFPGANDRLTTQMKSVGEAMAIGRTFQESLQKALRSLEVGTDGLDPMHEAAARRRASMHALREELRMPGPNRIRYVGDAFRAGLSLDEVQSLSRIDPWFLAQIEDLVREEQAVQSQGLEAFDRDRVRALKRKGFSDRRLATLLGHRRERACAAGASRWASVRSTSASTPAPPSSPPRPRTCTRPTTRSARRRRRIARRS